MPREVFRLIASVEETTYGCGTAPALDRLPLGVAKQYEVFLVVTLVNGSLGQRRQPYFSAV